MKLSIIIVNYNSSKLLRACLRSLFSGYLKQIRQRQFEIIVVDNASTENNLTNFKKDFPQVTFLFNRKNEGFAKANNWGVGVSRGEFVLFLNPDTIVPPSTLGTMLQFMQSFPRVGIATCKVVLPNGQLDDACHRAFPTPWRALTHFLGLGQLFPHSTFFNGYHLGYQSLEKIHEIDACVGAFLLIRQAVGAAVGWFDEDYFWYGEDIDLCYRVKQLNWQVMFVPEATITHYKGTSSGLKKHSQHLSQADLSTRRRATKARFAVMRIFYQKHYQNHYPRWLTGLVLMGIGLKQRLTEISL